jgi:demethylmenaquinone methyltransferase/2-methoxy-6-polyprenyl-1,4-benzoquinol methylase
MQHYYDVRAPEYDHAYTGEGVWDGMQPGLYDEVPALEAFVASLPAQRTLDVACGTGFLTRHLRGDAIGLDFSRAVLSVAREKRLTCPLVQGDALHLPFPDRSFERLFSSHFFGRLERDERARFMTEAKRVADSVVILDNPAQDGNHDYLFSRGHQNEGWEERPLLDGSVYTIYKKYFTPEELVEEMGGAEVLYSTEWFLAAAI